MIVSRIALIRTDLTFEIPPGRIASSISVDASRHAPPPSREPLAQRQVGDVAIAVVGPLREDGQDQLGDRIAVRLRARDTVERTQRVPDLHAHDGGRRPPRRALRGRPACMRRGGLRCRGLTRCRWRPFTTVDVSSRAASMPPAVRRSVPTLLAAAAALAYVLVSPPSRDLADALLRARLFGAAPFASGATGGTAATTARLQRSVPSARVAARPPARGGDRRHRERGAVHGAGPAGTSARARSSARCGSRPRRVRSIC